MPSPTITHTALCQGADVDGRPMTPDDDPEDPTFRRCRRVVTTQRAVETMRERRMLVELAEAHGWTATWDAGELGDKWPLLWCPRHSGVA